MPFKSSSDHLIRTKLNRPRVTYELVDRPRLYAVIDRRLPLTLVVAPAGFGKTTLVSRWAERCAMRTAWLSLDEGVSSYSVFVEYLLAALGDLFPELPRRIRGGYGSETTISYTTLATVLADELDAVKESFALILDDYHLVNDVMIHGLLAELLEYPPASLNLVVATRHEPPLPLGMMRAQSRLAEVRAIDLRFTTSEMADYLQRALDQQFDDTMLRIVEETTEGWAAGLHLAALFLRNQQDIAQAAKRLSGSNRLALEYLTVEVLAKQRPEVHSFLVKTSILQRMCPDLCDALLGNDPDDQISQRLLDELEREELFVTSLDNEHRWYRYHHIFQQLLAHKLRTSVASGEIAELYLRAGGWCAAHGLLDEALSYVLAGGGSSEAIRLVEQHRPAAINAEDWQQLEHWYQLLSRRDINAHPELLVLEAWVMHQRARLPDASGRLDLAETLLKDPRIAPEALRRLQSEIDVLRSQQYFRSADSARTQSAARSALVNAPPEYSGVRGLAWLFLAGGALLAGGCANALELLAAAVQQESSADHALRARLLIATCFVHWIGADMPRLWRTAEELLWVAKQHDLRESRVWGHYFRGCACYAQNNLSAAANDLLEVISNRQHAHALAFTHGCFALAAVLQAQGDSSGARTLIDTVIRYAAEIGNQAAQQSAYTFGAQLSLLQGQFDDAWRAVASAERYFHMTANPGFFYPPLIVSAVLLHKATPASLDEAEQLLVRVERWLAETHQEYFRIQALFSIAHLKLMRGQPDEAQLALTHAVRLAQPGNACRVFLDAPAEVQDLFEDLVLDGMQRVFVEQLGSTLSQRRRLPENTLAVPRELQPVPLLAQPRHPDLIELLTNRELQVLQLLSLRLTNKEIAQTLGISAETVKQHTMNVFRKLHVDNRRDAISQARVMGFQLSGLGAQ